MSVTHTLGDFKKELDDLLAQHLDEVIAETHKQDIIVANMLQYFKKTVLAGGKRIRPAMMYYGYVAAGGRAHKKIMRATISAELIHAFLLMHDDIVDRDDVRHGHKTIHAHYRRYAKRYGSTVDSDHFGTSVGIIVGDLVYSLGNHLLFSSRFKPAYIVRAMTKMQSVVGCTALGEMQDILMEYKGHADEQEILRMYENKTARYTFEGPFQLGALLAGATEKEAEALSRFALPMGIAFQLQDDYLGIFGSAKKTGKPVGSDIIEGKQTLFVARACQYATAAEQKTIRTILTKKKVTQKEIKTFCRIINDSGATASVLTDVTQYLEKAQEILEETKMPQKPKRFLTGLMTYLSEREF